MTYTIHVLEIDEDVQLEFGEELDQHYERQAARRGLTREAYLTDLALTLLIDKLTPSKMEQTSR